MVPADALALPPLLDAAELAAYLGESVSTIYDWRAQGKGPTTYHLGKHLGSQSRTWAYRSSLPQSATINPVTSALHVLGPTTPSTVKGICSESNLWNSRTAASVLAPNTPSTARMTHRRSVS
jgi:predicted DNA-binding transcriptional regulator AlpA